MKMIRRWMALCVLVAAAGDGAAFSFSDDFDANPLQLNGTPSGWTVTDGTVDLIGLGFFDYLPGNGVYIDLDGSTLDSGLLAHAFSLTGGVTYTASFDLAGRADGGTNSVAVSFGTAGATYSRLSTDPFISESLVFTPGASGLYLLSFQDSGNDNFGAMLDRVSVSAVPEAATAGLLAAGLGLLALGVRMRRRG